MGKFILNKEKGWNKVFYVFPDKFCDRMFLPRRIEYNNKGSRSNENKHELVYGESSSNARDEPDVCLSLVLMFTIFIIVVTQKLVLLQSKNVTAKCTEPLSPPPSIQYHLGPYFVGKMFAAFF